VTSDVPGKGFRIPRRDREALASSASAIDHHPGDLKLMVERHKDLDEFVSEGYTAWVIHVAHCIAHERPIDMSLVAPQAVIGAVDVSDPRAPILRTILLAYGGLVPTAAQLVYGPARRMMRDDGVVGDRTIVTRRINTMIRGTLTVRALPAGEGICPQVDFRLPPDELGLTRLRG
jgi:hypothetical protein